MSIGAFTGQFDLPLLLVQLFFLFFLGLVYHIRQEDKREGYPLVSNRTERSGGRVKVVGFPPLPAPKTFILPHGRPPVQAPREEAPDTVDADNLGNPIGMPIDPHGDPLLSRAGAAAWTHKHDEPDLSWDAKPLFMPMRRAEGFRVIKGDPDPRGFPVYGMDGALAGHVIDLWLDRGEHHARFLEVELAPALGGSGGATPLRAVESGGDVDTDDPRDPARGDQPGKVSDAEEASATAEWEAEAAVPAPPGRALLPVEFASVNGRRRTVRSAAITAAQFGGIPGRRSDTLLTALEEQRIRGYFGGGLLWNTSGRLGPLL